MSDPIEVDVAIIGAGISGVSAGYYLQRDTKLNYLIFENRTEMGGTWSLFQYPGIRSDTDMYTLGFPFNPWPYSQSIGQGDEICQYIKDTATKFGIDKKVRFGHRIKSASWSSKEKKWTLRIITSSQKEELVVKTGFVYSCTGFYNHDEGYYPELPGSKAFKGEIIRPQFWPKGLDYIGKRVAVVGSGATAVSLVPALAKKAEKVIMIQRSPSYLKVVPESESWPLFLKSILPLSWVYSYIRLTHMLQYNLIFICCQLMPEYSKRWLRYRVAQRLPPGVPLDPHFKPSYNPWDQRLCLVPDNGDFFGDLAKGRMEIITGVIDEVVPEGIRIKDSKEVVPVDMIVQATGIQVRAFGGIEITVDGTPVKASDRFQYRGMMLDGVPNFVHCMGYIHTSWTLGANLITQYVTRLLVEMESKGFTVVTPKADKDIVKVSEKPFPLSSNYLQRGIDQFPKFSDNQPWVGMSEPVGDWYNMNHGDFHKDLVLS